VTVFVAAIGDHALTVIERRAGELLYSDQRGPPVSNKTVVAAGVGLFAVGLAGLLARKRRRPPKAKHADPWENCTRDLNRSAAILAASVVLDSTMEHFRGNYVNRAMYVAPAMGAAAMGAALSGHAPHRIGTAIFGTSMVVGITGLGFHLYNIGKRPGGFSWNNIFYAAPFAAPGALVLSGLFGILTGVVHRMRHEPRRRQIEFAEGLAYTVSGCMLVTTSEAWVLHFRGAFHDPFMYVPVTVVPAAATALAIAGAVRTETSFKIARGLLNASAIIGALGVGFHVYGVQRNMGGWRNWSQMMFQGPPLPAPPSFTGLALAGMGALNLLRNEAGAKV
jgi:hypothetical protein